MNLNKNWKRMKCFTVAMSILALFFGTVNGTNPNDPVPEWLKEFNGNMIVLFYRPYCPFYLYINPLYNKVSRQTGDRVIFKEVDITAAPNYFKKTYGFKTVPTVIYFKDGKPVRTHGSENRSIKATQMKQYVTDIYLTP